MISATPKSEEPHFFAQTGKHSLAAKVDEIDGQFSALAEALGTAGTELVNLSPVSRLHSLRLVDVGAV